MTLPHPCPESHREVLRGQQLEREITELAAHINAANYRFLRLIGEFDRIEGWGGWGIRSCAHWLNFRCGIGMAAAREKVRVARVLEEVPKICAAFETGELSYSKVRALTRAANPENEEYLLMIAQHGTAAHIEKLVRSYRWMERQEELERSNKQHEERSLDYYYADDGSLVIKVRLPAEQGALVKAIDEAVEDIRKDVSCKARASPIAATSAGKVALSVLSCGKRSEAFTMTGEPEGVATVEQQGFFGRRPPDFARELRRGPQLRPREIPILVRAYFWH